jgi:hypothetical protein
MFHHCQIGCQVLDNVKTVILMEVSSVLCVSLQRHFSLLMKNQDLLSNPFLSIID